MTSSACCTTPSKRLWLAFAPWVLLFSTSLHAARLGQEPAASPQNHTDAPGAGAQETGLIQDFIAANTLQGEGKKPFHLLMSFQIFDLEGKPSEEGKLDYSWGGPKDFELTITSPSLGTVHNVRLDQVSTDAGRRALYLVNELLDDMRFPAASLGSAEGPLVTEKSSFGKLTLSCVLIPSTLNLPAYKETHVCTDNTSGTIRLLSGQNLLITRNRLGLFARTHVALDLAISYGNKMAAEGHVEKLTGYTSVQASTPSPAPTSTKKPYARLAGGVIAGSKISGEQPHYPETARLGGIQGTVLLLAVISPEGRITSLWPLASPNPTLTVAATDAVKTWTYRPYLLNGNPVEVNTTITVNFYLGRH